MPQLGKILKYAFVCAVFCGAAGLLLPAVHDLVEPRKIEYQQKQEAASLQALVPGAAAILAETASDGREYYSIYNEANELLGYALKISARGYSSDIALLLGLDTDFVITGFKVLSQAETPGLGTKIAEPSFVDKLLGRAALDLRLTKDGGDIDAITGATITSRAAINAMQQAASSLKSVLE